MCELNPNQNQKDLLNKFMSLHKELDEGTIENTQMATALWGQLTQFLNFIGPPYQSCAEWKMYWNHIKFQPKTGNDFQTSKPIMTPKIINNGHSSSNEISKKVSKIDSSRVLKKVKSRHPINLNKKLIKEIKTSSKIAVKKNIENTRTKKSIKDNKPSSKAQTKNRKKLKEHQSIKHRRKQCTSNRKSNNKSLRGRLKTSKRPKMSSSNSNKPKNCKLHVPCNKTAKKRLKNLRKNKKHYRDNI